VSNYNEQPQVIVMSDKTECLPFLHKWDKWGKVMMQYNGNKQQARRCKVCHKVKIRTFQHFILNASDELINRTAGFVTPKDNK